MGKLQKYWKSISIWKKAFYVSLVGTILWFLYEAINTFIVIFKNKTGIYQCAISIEKPCGLSEFILKSDNSILLYVSIVLVFVLLLIITNIISVLFHLYRKENKKSFWIALAIVIIILIALPFIIQYLQDIM
ncbi:hypothetical protein COV11_01230 [Candidatus Woesearchaeota archaeon CG10_big_fil_rev_8_21_14_0_10_30_7]|nr:MAG: hypothetical protein COV11_01230 [Candidatus Woesearchaeota archaeon CG10_big_fil_rev_8_21_14_0_10_30_7]